MSNDFQKVLTFICIRGLLKLSAQSNSILSGLWLGNINLDNTQLYKGVEDSFLSVFPGTLI